MSYTIDNDEVVSALSSLRAVTAAGSLESINAAVAQLLPYVAIVAVVPDLALRFGRLLQLASDDGTPDSVIENMFTSCIALIPEYAYARYELGRYHELLKSAIPLAEKEYLLAQQQLFQQLAEVLAARAGIADVDRRNVIEVAINELEVIHEKLHQG
jgi:hypothetical protein